VTAKTEEYSVEVKSNWNVLGEVVVRKLWWGKMFGLDMIGTVGVGAVYREINCW
jgi:hypothetical protein